MKALSKKAAVVSESATLAIAASAKKMKEENIDVISLSTGEPDFNTPANIRQSAIARIEHGQNGYTVTSGIIELKRAIAQKLKRDNALDYSPEQIIVSNGAKQSLYNACMAILNPDDELLLPTPCWVSYVEMIKLADARPVAIPTDEKHGFLPNIENLESAINAKTKAIIINSPNNPTGMVYDKELLFQIGELACKYDLYIISDEIYEKIIYGKKHYSIASLDPRFYERTITINGMSKAYSMTGWRIGYCASNLEIAKLMNNIQSHCTSAPNTIAQYSALEGITGDQSSIDMMRLEFQKRRDYVMEKLKAMPNLKAIEPDGAFYVFVESSHFINRIVDGVQITDSTRLCEILLEKFHLALVPGIAFGVENYLRISYATSMENLKHGMDRLFDFYNQYN